MNNEWLKNRLMTMAYILGIIVFLFIILSMLAKIKYAILLLCFCILLAYILTPLVNFFSRPILFNIPRFWKNLFKPEKVTICIMKTGLKRIYAIMAVYLIIFILIVLVLMFLVPIIGVELNKFGRNLPAFADQLQQYFEKLNEQLIRLNLNTPKSLKGILPESAENISEYLQNFSSSLILHSLPMAQSFITVFASIFIVPLLTFYILMDVERYKKGFLALFPPAWKKDVLRLMGEIDLVLGHYIRGQLIVCLCIGVSVTIVLLIFDIDYPYLIGAFSGIVEIIPYLGVIMGMIPALVLALMKSPWLAVGLFAVLYVVHWLEGHIIVPAVMGQTVRVPALIVVLSLIIGFEVLGIAGMVLAVPVAAIIKVFAKFYAEKIGSIPPSGTGEGGQTG
ncbi:MAG: AI-2E family transporter [Chloroflexi bacterium]|nr:AI-2E family transporter [Chloroflexota bacterium]